MKDDKFLIVNDDDVKITYERRKSPSNDDIDGFNPTLLLGTFIAVIVGLVVISQNNQTSTPAQQSPIIINNK